MRHSTTIMSYTSKRTNNVLRPNDRTRNYRDQVTSTFVFAYVFAILLRFETIRNWFAIGQQVRARWSFDVNSFHLLSITSESIKIKTFSPFEISLKRDKKGYKIHTFSVLSFLQISYFFFLPQCSASHIWTLNIIVL